MAFVDLRQLRTVEDLTCVGEIQATLLKRLGALGFVKLDQHRLIVWALSSRGRPIDCSLQASRRSDLLVNHGFNQLSVVYMP